MKRLYNLQSVTLLVLVFTLFCWGCAEKKLTLLVRFPEVSGLKTDDHVYFGRSQIGQVNQVSYTNEGDFLVEVSIVPEFKEAATEDSRFYIDRDLVDQSTMAIIVEQERPGGTILMDGATVEGSVRAGYLDDMFKALKGTADKAESELNRALEEWQKTFDSTSKQMSRDLQASLEDVSRRFDSFKEEVGKLPDSREVHELEESFRQLADEFDQAQKDVQEHIRDEILPRLRKELDHLRDQLKERGRDKELEELDRQVRDMEMI